jgi:UDP-glucose 4-epimerase
LFEAAVEAGVGVFVLTSTTSTYGRALTPPREETAIWVTAATVPRARNFYGATKVAAQQLAEVVHLRDGLPVVILRTSRFFPEPHDRPEFRGPTTTPT